jgi:outer membrane lipoprotein SlyB
MSPSNRRRGDPGQAVPLVLGVLAVATVLLLALVPLGRATIDRGRAVAAADAAALAGAAEGEAAARELAARNGAELVAWRSLGPDVWVVVVAGDARAEARARREVIHGADHRR